MKKISIAAAIRTLRRGDVIRNLACRTCASKSILVLDRGPNDAFELSMPGDEVTIIRNTRGPFQWNTEVQVFVDKDGRPYDHIGPESVVSEGAGPVELDWYDSLPKAGNAPFHIDPKNLLGTKLAPGTHQKLDALIARIKEGGAEEQLQSMQLVIQFIFGDTQLSEQQMRLTLATMASYGRLLAAQSGASGIDSLMAAMLMSMVGGEDGLGGLDDLAAMFQDGPDGFGRDPRRGMNGQGRGNGAGRPERRTAGAGMHY